MNRSNTELGFRYKTEACSGPGSTFHHHRATCAMQGSSRKWLQLVTAGGLSGPMCQMNGKGWWWWWWWWWWWFLRHHITGHHRTHDQFMWNLLEFLATWDHLRPPELLVSVSSDGNVLQWSLKKGRRAQLGTACHSASSTKSLSGNLGCVSMT